MREKFPKLLQSYFDFFFKKTHGENKSSLEIKLSATNLRTNVVSPLSTAILNDFTKHRKVERSTRETWLKGISL